MIRKSVGFESLTAWEETCSIFFVIFIVWRVGSSGVRSIIVITYCIFLRLKEAVWNLDQKYQDFGLKDSCEDVFLIVFSYNVCVSFIVNSNECIFFWHLNKIGAAEFIHSLMLRGTCSSIFIFSFLWKLL